ncbi:hypothetical protein U1Q18_009651, partial [Sarracenia purpurea var. burkii]
APVTKENVKVCNGKLDKREAKNGTTIDEISSSVGEDESEEDADVSSEEVKEEGNSKSPGPLVCEDAVTVTEGARSVTDFSSTRDDEDAGNTGMDGEEASEDDAGAGEDEDEAEGEQGLVSLPDPNFNSVLSSFHSPNVIVEDELAIFSGSEAAGIEVSRTEPACLPQPRSWANIVDSSFPNSRVPKLNQR